MTVPDTDPQPRVGVLAQVWRDGQALLVQRGRAPDKGKWGFPGGRLHWGERLADGALRELREETGIAAEPLGVLTTLEAIVPATDDAPAFHYVLVAILATWRDGEAVAQDDAAAVRWVDPQALPDLPYCRDVAALLTLGAARLPDWERAAEATAPNH